VDETFQIPTSKLQRSIKFQTPIISWLRRIFGILGIGFLWILDVGDWSFGVSVAEILEICGHTEIPAAHELNHSLEFVFLFPRDPDLLVLQLALHLEAL